MFRFAAIALALLIPAESFAQTVAKVCPPHTVVPPGAFRGGFGFGGFNRFNNFGFNHFINPGLIQQPIIVSQPTLPVVAFGGNGFGYGGFGAGYGFGASAGCCGSQVQAFVPQFAATGSCCGQAQFQQQVVAPPVVASSCNAGFGAGYGAGFGAVASPCATGAGFGFGATPTVLGGGCGVNPAFVGAGLGFNNGFGFNRGFGFGRGLFGLGGRIPLISGILNGVLGNVFPGSTAAINGNAFAGRRFAGVRR